MTVVRGCGLVGQRGKSLGGQAENEGMQENATDSVQTSVIHPRSAIFICLLYLSELSFPHLQK